MLDGSTCLPQRSEHCASGDWQAFVMIYRTRRARTRRWAFCGCGISCDARARASPGNTIAVRMIVVSIPASPRLNANEFYQTLREIFDRLNFDEFISCGFCASACSVKKRRVSSAVEQRFCKPLVGGSSPSPGTNKINNLTHFVPAPSCRACRIYSRLVSMLPNRCRQLHATRSRHVSCIETRPLDGRHYQGALRSHSTRNFDPARSKLLRPRLSRIAGAFSLTQSRPPVRFAMRLMSDSRDVRN